MSSSQSVISIALDCHEWATSADAEPCTVLVAGKPCGMLHGKQCSDCGIRRHGPFADSGNPHFFCYDQSDDGTSQFVPPCQEAPAPSQGVVEAVAVCAHCDHEIKNGSCPSGHQARARRLRWCRRIA